MRPKRPRGLLLIAALAACSGGLEATSTAEAETATATASTSTATDGVSSTSAATSPATTTTTTTATAGSSTTTTTTGCCTPFCDLEAPACSPGTECLPLDWLQLRDDFGIGGCVIPP